MTQTILLTGATGYIAKHIALKLLNAGYVVRATVRKADRSDEVREAVRPQLVDPTALDRLSFVTLALDRDDGWAAAMDGVDVLMHTASPFPTVQPRDEDDLIRPAVDGTLRALRAAKAAGVSRVVLTSSVAAVAGTELATGKTAFDEADWTNLTYKANTPYDKSKTKAERAAWDFVALEAPDMALTTINPVLVLGPPLDPHFGTSVSVVERILNAKDPMQPRYGFSCVDVRDVAEMHLRVLTQDEAKGERFIASDRFLWFADIAAILKAAHPERRIITRVAPSFLLRILALFDRSIGTILPQLGRRTEVSSAKAQRVLGMTFIPADQSVRDTARFLIANGSAK